MLLLSCCHYRTTSIMSSKDKERVVEEMWQKEKMFDELLALILQGTFVFSCKSIDQIFHLWLCYVFSS